MSEEIVFRMPPIKPCPFCGTEARVEGNDRKWVRCKNPACKATCDDISFTVNEAIDKWNRRFEEKPKCIVKPCDDRWTRGMWKGTCGSIYDEEPENKFCPDCGGEIEVKP